VCKAAQFAIRSTRKMLHPYSTGNFEAGGPYDTPSHVYKNTRHFPDRHLETEFRQNPLTDKLNTLRMGLLNF